MRTFAVAIWTLVGAGCSGGVDPSRGGLDRAFGEQPRDPVPAGVDETYRAFVLACRAKDPSALWAIFGPQLRDQVDAQASNAAATGSRDFLFFTYGYEGHPGGFDGTALLAGLVNDQTDRNPCLDADLWRRREVATLDEGQTYIVEVQRPDGRRHAVLVGPSPQRWVVLNISTPIQPQPGT